MNLPAKPSILHRDPILFALLQFCDNRTLARLARTATFICEPALDVLWRDLESFSHLLGTFPSELLTWANTNDPWPRPTVSRLIVPRDWKRFSYYARRVRSWGPEDLNYVAEPLVDHLAFGRDPDYILPRLTHMKVSGSTISGIHLSTLLLCSSLESVSVRNDNPDAHPTRSMFTFFRTLADRSPRLKEFSVEWGSQPVTDNNFKDGITDVLMQNPSSLTSVKLWTPNCIDSRGFACLSSLPNLTTLHLNLINAENIHNLRSEVQNSSGAFASLQNLFLAGESKSFHQTLQCFGNVPGMACLGFSVQELPKAEDLKQLFQTLSQKFQTLKILQFNIPKEEINTHQSSRRYYLQPEIYHHDITVLSPLLQMPNLVAVHLELGVPLYLNDQELSTIGMAWPSIEVLNLCSNPFNKHLQTAQPIATILGLLSLTRSCPSLRHLGLFLNCCLDIPDNLIVSETCASRVLVHLDVGRSRVVEPARVAALLSGAYPALKVFQWTGMDVVDSVGVGVGGMDGLEGTEGSEFAVGWKQVYDLLPVFRAVRANERKVAATVLSEY